MKPEAPADPRVWGRAVFSGPGDEIQELFETFDFMADLPPIAERRQYTSARPLAAASNRRAV